MFRRSRFSIRPNVGTAGRAAATPQEAPSGSQEASETPRDVSESSTATAVTDNKSAVTPSEKPTAPGDDQNGEGTSSSAAVQRRKRFSIKPKVAPGRPPTLARTPKSPVKAVSETPVRVPGSDLDKPTTSSQTGTTTAPKGLQSPRRRRPSEESKQPKVQQKPMLISSDSSIPSAVPPAEDSLEQTHLLEDSGRQLESMSGSQVKEVPCRLPDKVPPSLPIKETIEISEKAKTILSSKSGLSLSPPAFSLSRLLNDPSDLQRLAKAKKLRELLKQEMHKEKKFKKAKARATEYTLDPAKMTMRDLIRYLPVSNPMTSSLEDSEAQENETVVPPSSVREESPERAQEPEVLPKVASPREEEEEEAEDAEEEAPMVPQVKVAEDGSLIIDEESLTVEVQRAKGPNTVQDRDPIFERGSTTTYSSFRKGTYSKPWSSEETDMFFLAISMVGTDFSMICQLFPHRARSEIKNKFKKEERVNAWRIDKAFRERRKLDIEYFSKLLEKILEVQQNRKKLKSLAEKNSPKKHKRKAKGKKAAKKLKDVEKEDEEEVNEIPDLEGEEEEEGEKENEDLCNEGGTPVSKPKKKHKRKNIQDASTEEPNDKKNKMGEKSNEQDEADTPEDAEAALPEDRTSSDISEKNENAAKDTVIKPAKLSRGRAPKPLLPLGRKSGKKPPPPSSNGKDTASDKGDGSVSDGASKEKVNKDASPLRQASKRKSDNDDISAEEEDATVEPPRPTRYGRVPKPTKPLTYAAKEDAHSSASENTPASPAGSTASSARPTPKCTAKRGRSSKQQSAQESKKPKLVTLRASRSEYSDEENEQQWEEEEVEEEQHPTCSSSKDGIASAFVPASLRSPHPVISEVEETMEELDILANMPDVLGISQDALCPGAFCEQAQNETGTAEPCEHQLDLLVDVIDFLSSEHTEVCEDESYNEAAHTLLTIGNLAHLSQSAQNQIAIQDHITGTTSSDVNETSQHLEEEIASKSAAQEENSATLTSATSGHGVTETSETDALVELQNSTTDNGDMPVIKTSDQRTGSDMDPTSQLHSSPESSKRNSPQTRRRRLSKVKPKPNLGQASKTAQSKSQPETPTLGTAIESQTVAPGLSQATETLSAAKETPKIVDCYQDISCIEVKLTEEPSGLQESSDGQVTSGAATSDQSVAENQSQSFSDAQFEPSLEQATRDLMSTSESTDEILMSHVGTTESSCSSLLTTDSAVPESQVEQGSNKDSAPVQKSSDHPATCVTHVEELPVSQKEESEVASTHQTRKSRFQKGKPKPNLAQTSRTVRSKPQPRKDTVEKDCNPTPNPKSHEKTVVEVEAEPTCTTSCEKPSQSSGPTSDFIPSLDLGSTLTSTEELSATEEKKMDVGIVGGQVESGAAASHQSASENQNFSEAKCELSGEQATRDTRPTPESTDEKQIRCCNPLTSDSAVPESQVEQGSNIDLASVQESSDHPVSCVTHVEELPVSQKEESEVTSTCQTRKSRLQNVKPATHMQLVEKPFSPTSRSESTLNTIAEEEAQPTCSTTPPKKTSEIKSTGTASVSVPSLELSSTLEPTEELPLTQEQITDVGLDSSSGGSQPNVPQRRQRFPKVKPKPNLGSSSRTTQSKDICKPSEQWHMDTLLSTKTHSTTDLKENTQQPRSKNDSGAQSQDAVQQCSETTETNQTAAQSTYGDQSKPTHFSILSRKAPQSPRGRLVKPKPNLRRSSQQVHSTKQAEADVDAAVSHKPVSELQTDIQEPVEGALEQGGNQNFPPNDAGSSLGCLTQVPDISTQDASTLSTGHPSLTILPDMLSEQVPSDPEEPFFILSLTEIPVCSSGEVVDCASEPLPYVPVTDAPMQQQSCVPGESLAAAGDGPLTNVAVPVSMEEGGETSLVNVKDIGPDPAAYVDSIVENPVDPHEGTTVRPSKLLETVESNDETEIPPTKPRLIGTGRRAKLQVNPNTPRKKEASKTLAARGAETIPIQTNATQDSELPGSSVTQPQKGSGEPEDSSSGAQTTQTSTPNRKPKGFLSFLSETNNAAPSSDSPPGKAASKRPKVKTPRAARKRSTPAPGASTPYDVAPTPSRAQPPMETHSTSSTKSPTQTEVDIEQTSEHSRLRSDPTPSTSLCTAEVSTSQLSDCAESSSVEEEPTNVSQYFLSDIFTEVEEG